MSKAKATERITVKPSHCLVVGLDLSAIHLDNSKDTSLPMKGVEKLKFQRF